MFCEKIKDNIYIVFFSYICYVFLCLYMSVLVDLIIDTNPFFPLQNQKYSGFAKKILDCGCKYKQICTAIIQFNIFISYFSKEQIIFFSRLYQDFKRKSSDCSFKGLKGSRIRNACIVFHVSCIMYHVSCIMYHVSCIMYHVSCIMYHISCIMYHVSCIMYHVSCIVYHVSCMMYDV